MYVIFPNSGVQMQSVVKGVKGVEGVEEFIHLFFSDFTRQ